MNRTEPALMGMVLLTGESPLANAEAAAGRSGLISQSQELSCPSVRFNTRVGTGAEDACLWINGDGRVRT